MISFSYDRGIVPTIRLLADRLAAHGLNLPDSPVTLYVAASGRTFHAVPDCSKAQLSPVEVRSDRVADPSGVHLCARQRCSGAGFYDIANRGWAGWSKTLLHMVNLADALSGDDDRTPFERYGDVSFLRSQLLHAVSVSAAGSVPAVHPDVEQDCFTLMARAAEHMSSSSPSDPVGFVRAVIAGQRLRKLWSPNAAGQENRDTVEMWSGSRRVLDLFPPASRYTYVAPVLSDAVSFLTAQLLAGTPGSQACESALEQVRERVDAAQGEDPFFAPTMPDRPRFSGADFDHPGAWMAAEWRYEALEHAGELLDGAVAWATAGVSSSRVELVAVEADGPQRTRPSPASGPFGHIAAAASFAFPQYAHDGLRLRFFALPTGAVKLVEELCSWTPIRVGSTVKVTPAVLECAEALWSAGDSLSVADAVAAAKLVTR